MIPKIKTQKIYPELRLKPQAYSGTNDHCKIIYREDHMEIQCYVDGTGNWFKLPYENIKRVIDRGER